MDNNTIAQIYKLEPHPTEAIVIRFNMNKIDIDNLRMIYDQIKKEFPNNSVCCLPDALSLESCSKDVLENFISMMAEIIETL